MDHAIDPGLSRHLLGLSKRVSKLSPGPLLERARGLAHGRVAGKLRAAALLIAAGGLAVIAHGASQESAVEEWESLNAPSTGLWLSTLKSLGYSEPGSPKALDRAFRAARAAISEQGEASSRGIWISKDARWVVYRDLRDTAETRVLYRGHDAEGDAKALAANPDLRARPADLTELERLLRKKLPELPKAIEPKAAAARKTVVRRDPRAVHF